MSRRAGRNAGRAARLRWWHEVLFIVFFYAGYTAVRNTQGSATVSAAQAFANARRVISLERALGIYHEETIQDWFLSSAGFVSFWNVFYGAAHFLVTAGALIWLFWAAPHRYRVWRNTLAFTTGLALVGFATFPLMPPRLLPASYGYLDTLRFVGGLWSFDSGPMAEVSNQYAAMPSLHIAWACWSALVLYPAARRVGSRLVVAAYPFATLFAVVITANHFVLDAVGGLVVLGAGFLLARLITSRPAAPARPEEEPGRGLGEQPVARAAAHAMEKPPSTTRVSPVWYAEAGLAR